MTYDIVGGKNPDVPCARAGAAAAGGRGAHGLRRRPAFKHYLLGSCALAPRPPDGYWSDFDLRTDNQAIMITWLKTIRHPDGPAALLNGWHGPAASKGLGDPDSASQQEPFSRLGRDAPISAGLAVLRAVSRWAETRWVAAAAFPKVAEAGALTSVPARPRGGGPVYWYVWCPRKGAGETPAPTPPTSSDDHFLAPSFVRILAQARAVDAFFRPVRGAAATLGKPVERHCSAFLVLCALLYRRAHRTGCVSLRVRYCVRRCSAGAATGRWGGTFGGPLRTCQTLAGSLGVADQRPATCDPGRNQRPSTRDPERPRPGHDARVTPRPGRGPGPPSPARSPLSLPLQLCLRKQLLLRAPGHDARAASGGLTCVRVV